jgi:hypothetical protein
MLLLAVFDTFPGIAEASFLFFSPYVLEKNRRHRMMNFFFHLRSIRMITWIYLT